MPYFHYAQLQKIDFKTAFNSVDFRAIDESSTEYLASKLSQLSSHREPAMLTQKAQKTWLVYQWLAQQDVLPSDYDLLWIGGSKFLAPVQQAIQLYHLKPVKIVITGGIGRDTAKFRALTMDGKSKQELEHVLDGLYQMKNNGPDGNARMWAYIGKKFHIVRGRDDEIIRQRAEGILKPGHTEWRAFYKMLNSGKSGIDQELESMDKERITIEEYMIDQLIDPSTRLEALVPEALGQYAILLANGVKDEDILLEAQSTTGLENVTFGAKVLNENHITPANIVSIHYDEVQRRTRAAYERQLPGNLNGWDSRQNHVYAYAPRALTKDDLARMPEDELDALRRSMINEINRFPGLFENGSIFKINVPDNIQSAADNASTSIAKPNQKGGIDFTPDKISLEIKNAGRAIQLHMDPAMLHRLQSVRGFVPVVIGFQPLKSLYEFLQTPELK